MVLPLFLSSSLPLFLSSFFFPFFFLWILFLFYFYFFSFHFFFFFFFFFLGPWDLVDGAFSFNRNDSPFYCFPRVSG